MRADNIIKREGFTALAEKLDPVELERFIVLLNREKFYYGLNKNSEFSEIQISKILSFSAVVPKREHPNCNLLRFPYTKWRKDLFEDMTIEQISEEAEKYSAGLDKK